MEAIAIKFNGKNYFGFKTCPQWLKDKWREVVKFTCVDCNKHEDKVGTLEIHRVIRGVEKGLYVVVPLNHPLNNVKIVCNKCHKKYNYSRRCP